LVGESVFVRSGSTWAKQEQFSGSSTLGQGVALSADGNLALLDENGAASVFVRSGSSWSLREIVKPSTEGRFFGRSAALSSDASTAAIGGDSGAWVFVGQAKKAKEVGTCSVANARTGQSYTTLQGAVDAVPFEGEATLTVSGICHGDTSIVGYQTVTIVGRGHATLDGDNSALNPGAVLSVFFHPGGPRVKITGLTITGGYGSYGRWEYPSGISLFEAQVTLNDSTVTGNTGGGIGTGESGYITLNNSTVTGNATSGNGGGISNQGGAVDLNNSTVAGNSASGCGGGVVNGGFPGEITLHDSSVTRNIAAGNGGGICEEEEGDMFITINGSSSVSHNTASGNGGGIYNGDNGSSIYAQHLVTLNDSASVTRNTAFGKGGGIYNQQTNGATITFGTGWKGTVSDNLPDNIFNF
jgi:predicted outer membrane repeat protein